LIISTRIVMESWCVWYNIYRYLAEEKWWNVVLSNPYQEKSNCFCKNKDW